MFQITCTSNLNIFIVNVITVAENDGNNRNLIIIIVVVIIINLWIKIIYVYWNCSLEPGIRLVNLRCKFTIAMMSNLWRADQTMLYSRRERAYVKNARGISRHKMNQVSSSVCSDYVSNIITRWQVVTESGTKVTTNNMGNITVPLHMHKQR